MLVGERAPADRFISGDAGNEERFESVKSSNAPMRNTPNEAEPYRNRIRKMSVNVASKTVA